MKGISPLISAVILILIVIMIAATIGPWMLDLAKRSSEGASTDVEQDLICRQTAYNFDSDYGSSGVAWTFGDKNGTVSAKIINTGTQNLYNFSFELTVKNGTSEKMVVYPYVNITFDTRKTKADPLKPGQSWILDADLNTTGTTLNLSDYSLSEVKVINDVCPRVSPSLEL